MKTTSFIDLYKSKIDEHLLKIIVSSFFDGNINYDYELNEAETKKLESQIKEVISGKPVQYVVGNVDFYGYTFDVNDSVLIPRFETETLVEKTINYIKKYFNKSVDIVDLGTGSGCIAITLKKKIDCNIDAVDISSSALSVAKSNAKKNNALINFIEGDMLKPLDKRYDVIISNPPYIDPEEEIMDIVKDNEPSIALYALDHGMYYYKEIIKNAKNYLNERFIIAFEIGYKQGEELKEYAKKYFPDAFISVENDLSEKNRYLFIISE